MRYNGLTAFLLLCLLVFCVAGCGSDDDAATDGDSPDGDSPDGDDPDGDDPDGDSPDGDDPDGDDPDGDDVFVLPDALPFSYSREQKGEALSEQEVADFTKKITGFWKDVDVFNWVLRISSGVDASTGYPDYALWWHDVKPVKSGDLVTFTHSDQGGGHNIMIPSMRVLTQAAAGYLLTGDETMGKVVEQFAKGLTATMKGMVYDDDDPLEYLMARNIVTFNHEFTIEDDKRKAVDYTGWYSSYSTWNTGRFLYTDNPYWGEVWVTNMRSKDDVPHIFRATAWLWYVSRDAEHDWVKAAVDETLTYMVGFTKDIVDSGYYIRSKDENGEAYIPSEDLASFVTFEVVDANAECTAKLNSALIAYHEPLENDCLDGSGGTYESVATGNHYYNYDIVQYFHVAAALHSLIFGQDDMAEALVEGLASRADYYGDPDSDAPHHDHEDWNRDLATFLLGSATAGLPLTNEEARLIQYHYGQAVDEFTDWPYWDLWDASVPDGTYDYNPRESSEATRMENIAVLLEYCASPFRNPAGASPVDCDVIADMGSWGE